MPDIGRVTQLSEVIAQAHPLDKTQRKLGLFAAFQQLQHFAHGHARSEAIGARLKVRKFRLNAQQPLEYTRTIDNFIAIQLLAKRLTPGPRFQGKNRLVFNQDLTIRQLADFPHSRSASDTERNDEKENNA